MTHLREVARHKVEADALELLGVVLLRERERGRDGLDVDGLAEAALADAAQAGELRGV